MTYGEDSATGFSLPSDERYVDPIVPGLSKRETFAAQFTAALIIATNTDPKSVERGAWVSALVEAGLVMADAQIAGLNKENEG